MAIPKKFRDPPNDRRNVIRPTITGRDPASQLYRAVERYVRLKGGAVVVIGGIELQRTPGDGPNKFKLAVKCTGRTPEVPL